MIEARAETVGSLLRPDYLIQARAASDDVSAAEDRGVRDAIQLQESAGLEIITDGENVLAVWALELALQKSCKLLQNCDDPVLPPQDPAT